MSFGRKSMLESICSKSTIRIPLLNYCFCMSLNITWLIKFECVVSIRISLAIINIIVTYHIRLASSAQLAHITNAAHSCLTFEKFLGHTHFFKLLLLEFDEQLIVISISLLIKIPVFVNTHWKL